jgi:DNA-binding protein HU-beta
MHLSRYSFRISEFYWIFTIDDFENLCRDITNLNHNDFKIQTEGGQMTKAELIEKMAKDANLTKAAAGRALDSFLDGVTQGLKKQNSKVTLVGFGTFRNVYRKTRKGRNPQTGEQIKIKGRNTVKFKAGKALRAKI